MAEKIQQDTANTPQQPGSLYFVAHTQQGYENAIQFFSDIFWFGRQLCKTPADAGQIALKLDQLDQTLRHTPKAKRITPMNWFLEYARSLTERIILVLLIRRSLCGISRPLELEDVLPLSERGLVPLSDVFLFFAGGKGTLRQSPCIAARANGCMLAQPVTLGNPEEKPKPKRKKNISPLFIQKQLDKFVIGQQEAKQKLSVAFFEHLLKSDLLPPNSGLYKNNVLLVGPTGTGKTYLCRMLARVMQVPFLHVDMSQYTASGYVGSSVKDIISDLAKMARVSPGTTLPVSIVFLDEIDKITAKNTDGNGRDVRGGSVQEELLRMLESRVMQVETHSPLRSEERTYDISKVFFVAAGACSGLEKIISQRLKAQQTIGFVRDGKEGPLSARLEIQDLLEYGFLKEFLSRFSYIAPLFPLTQAQLTDVLLRSKDNLLMQYKQLFGACKQPLRFSPAQVAQLAQKAYGHQLGVRALNQLLTDHLRPQLENLHYRRYETKNESFKV